MLATRRGRRRLIVRFGCRHLARLDRLLDARQVREALLRQARHVMA
jgi:hypothetical protein